MASKDSGHMLRSSATALAGHQSNIHITYIYIYMYLNVYIYIHICTSLTGTSLESNQVLLFQPLTLFLVFGTLNLHKGVVAIGAAYPSSNHFKHMKLQMFPFQFHQKKAQTWSHGVKTWMCSWQVYNVRDPSILGQPPNWGSLVVGAASILGTSKNAEKKGGKAGRVLSEAAHLFAIPCSKKMDGTLTVQVQSILSFVFCLLTMVS